MRVTVNGQEFEIPAGFAHGITGKELKERTGVPEDQVIYEIDSEGGYRVIRDDETITPREGARFGAISRFRAG